MITAKEASQLSGPSAEDYLNHIDKMIREAAKNKARQIMIRDEPYARWLYGQPAGEAKLVLDTLKKNGYTVEHYYKEHSIAVDMALVIKW
jgi:hypothetical protein